MNKKMSVFSLSVVAAHFSFAAVGSDVAVSQDAVTRMVKITYTLTAPAIVTFDASAGGVSVGDEALANAAGDVYKYVDKVGEPCVIWWQPARQLEPCAVEKAQITVKAWSLDAPPPYMVVDLDVPNAVRFYPSEVGLPYGGITNDMYRTTRLLMRRISAAGVTWRMGSPTTQYWRTSVDGETAHLVTMARDYYIGVFEFTRYQYGRVNDSSNPTGMLPQKANMETLRGNGTGCDWPNDGHAVASDSFMQALRTRTGLQFDLPTEAQWEYACRAGSALALYYSDSDDTELKKIAWCYGNAVGTLQKVGTRMSNAWGIYDMLGNIDELCLDYAADYSSGTQYEGEPAGPKTGSNGRISRGGNSWDGGNSITTSFRRRIGAATANDFYGFRVVCPATYVPPAQ